MWGEVLKVGTGRKIEIMMLVRSTSRHCGHKPQRSAGLLVPVRGRRLPAVDNLKGRSGPSKAPNDVIDDILKKIDGSGTGLALRM